MFETSTDFTQYDAFFVGEFHGVHGIGGLNLALIKYVNQHCGVTNVFMEFSYSAAWLYNAYLATGDTTLFTDPLLLTASRQVNRDFWKKLYEYNKGLEHKITIRGMDFERIEFLKVLRMLKPENKDKPVVIATTINYLDTLNLRRLERTDDIQDSVYKAVRREMSNHKVEYAWYYGSNYKTVSDIMFNPDEFRKYNSRNTTMYKNMKSQIEQYHIKKFITFNGLQHGDMNQKGILCGNLKIKMGLKNKLADISFLCKNCYDFNGTWSHPVGGVHEFEQPFRTGTNFDLLFSGYFNNACKYTFVPTKNLKNKKLRKFSDFVILMKDEPPF